MTNLTCSKQKLESYSGHKALRWPPRRHMVR